jgi:glutathione S-transferase
VYYREQKQEAARRAADFIGARLPKFFDYFESVLARNRQDPGWLAGAALTYARAAPAPHTGIDVMF